MEAVGFANEERMQIAGLAHENDTSYQTIEKLTHENVELKNQIAAAENERDAAQGALDHLDEILMDLVMAREELKEKEKQLEESKSLAKTYEVENLGLRQERDGLSAQLQEKADALEKREKEFQEQAVALQKALSKPAIVRKPTKLSNRPVILKETIENKHSLEVQSQETKSLNMQLGELQDLLELGESALSQAEDERRKAELDKQLLLNDLAARDRESCQMQVTQTQLQELQASLQTKEAALSQSEVDKQRAEQDATQLRNELAARDQEAQQTQLIQTQLRELQGSLQVKETALSQLEIDKQRAGQEATQLHNELAATRQERLNAETALVSHANELESLRELTEFLRTTNDRSSMEYREMSSKNWALEEAIKAKDFELSAKQGEVQSLYDHIDELQKSGFLGS
jgi:chromosome segregation ATPase